MAKRSHLTEFGIFRGEKRANFWPKTATNGIEIRRVLRVGGANLIRIQTIATTAAFRAFMKLVERYIFDKAGTATLVTLGSLAGVVWIVQVLRGIDIINNKGQTILAFLSLTSLAVPDLLLAIIPVALLISTIHTINAMNNNTELVVVTASGCSNWTIAKPLLFLALLCSIFAGIVGHVVSPLSLVKLNEFITDMRADLVSVIIQEGTFNTIDDGLTFHIADRRAAGVIGGILIADDRDEDTSIIYSAREGIITRNEDGSLLKLKDGAIQQTNRKDGTVSLIKFQSYVFDLSSFSAERPQKSRRAKERMTTELFFPNPNDEYFQKNPGRFRSQIHERFSEMLWPFAYVLIILAFCGQARSNRQSFSSAITTATVCVIIARGMGFSAINTLKSDPSAVWYVYALPIGCILVGSFFVIRNRPAGLPKPVMQRVEQLNMKIAMQVERFQDAYKTYRRRRAGVEA
jgi:lipopolysaccharide export system permease protein